MKQRNRTRRNFAISAASVGLALALTGCDARPATGSSQTSVKTIRVGKDAPIEQRLRALIVAQLKLKTMPKPTDRLVEDLGADSLDCVELVMAMEEEFRIIIPNEEAEKLKTLADLVAYLEKSAPVTTSNVPGVFQMRLVLDEPSTNSELLAMVSLKGAVAMPEVLFIEKQVLLDETAVQAVQVARDEFGSAQIALVFTDAGRQRFAEITKTNVRKRLAIVGDGQIYSAPKIVQEITEGTAMITGNFTMEEAQALVEKITENLKK